ncbi:hypothetical protein [Flavobacterium sp.]|uniref:hypothetical protein n=1 Tax=Flavobacterium sp. TaxID=239 RepID=UPI0011F82D2D|nr:hypothetical protein [Flavobacterium sp.]RZJ70518.1 MAG: hypothetical protein EOO49_13745 [Flavobacterium sp.]
MKKLSTGLFGAILLSSIALTSCKKETTTVETTETDTIVTAEPDTTVITKDTVEVQTTDTTVIKK